MRHLASVDGLTRIYSAASFARSRLLMSDVIEVPPAIVIPRLAGTMTDAVNFSGQTNGRLSYPAWGLLGCAGSAAPCESLSLQRHVRQRREIQLEASMHT